MKTADNCMKNSSCQLWQVLCDGKPCVVETEIQASSHSIPKSNKIWHLSKFKLKEIIDLAVKMKKTGSHLYKKLARKSSNRQLKNMLLYLAAEEERHQLKLRELSSDPDPVLVPEAYPGQHYEYIGSIVETHIMNGENKLEGLLENTCSEQELIKLAIDFEKDTLLFLNGFRDLVLKDKREIIDELLTDEQAHLVKLVKLRKSFMAQRGQYIIKTRRYPKATSVTEIRPQVI